MRLRILLLYPDLLNLEQGNIPVLLQRAKWRGIDTEVKEAKRSEPWPVDDSDLVFIGSGTLEAQTAIIQDWPGKVSALAQAVDNGLALLAIGIGFQLMGTEIRTHGNDTISGAGIFNMVTEIKPRRLEGPIAVKLPFLRSKQPMVGYENHHGHTRIVSISAAHERTATPLGRVIYGQGNNGLDQTEGARYKNAVGTYIQGPVLARNPHLADFLLEQALSRRYGHVHLSPLDDRLENQANQEFYLQYRPHPIEQLLLSRRR
ncbi:MAG: type 1 glutamine amidotransferase [bacterium]|jgi:CobQ-like glutamine amidotransferase family enzyme